MKLTQSGSLWGNIYRLRHFINGVRVTDAHFRQVYEQHGLTPERGVYTQTSTTFRKDWIV